MDANCCYPRSWGAFIEYVKFNCTLPHLFFGPGGSDIWDPLVEAYLGRQGIVSAGRPPL